MYESYYGLNEKPFNLNPDSEYLYMSPAHEDAYTHLLYAIAENKGFVIITGEIGSGKTTLINYLLNEIDQEIQIGLINNTYFSPTQFMRTLCREFEIETEATEKTVLMDQIHEFLIEKYAAQKRVVLIVDEAQNLSPKLLEEIRMLSNLEAEKSHLIQIILVGQPELKVKLRRSDLKQFVQRVTVHYHLNALNQNEVEKYIKYRLKIGGAKKPDHFDNDAIEAISKYSRGIPRLINILCDTSLVYGFAESKPKIDKQIVEDVVKERAAGGILSIDDTGDHENAAQPLIDDIYDDAPAGEHNELRFLKERIKLIEQKSDLLEKTIHEMNNALSRLTDKKDEKDALLLELFKMLKNNMDSRMKTLLHLNNTQSPISLKK